MKLGVSYNIFNGDELLKDSLTRMRKVSNYIVLTYQTTSNQGNKSSYLSDELNKLDKSLYDDLVLFEPDFKKKPQRNETKKRNLGLIYAKKNKCTHFISVDCDEFYDLNSFEKAKKSIIDNDYKTTACELVNYFHSSKYQMIEKSQFVPFIFKISWFKKHKYKQKFPVIIDPTRGVKPSKFFLFPKEDLLMHHMSYVRKDLDSIKSKLVNSPNKRLFKDVLEDYLDYYNNWNEQKPALNPHQFKNKASFSAKIIIKKESIPLSVYYKKQE